MSDSLKEYVERESADFEVFSFDADAGWSEIAEKVSAPAPKQRNPWMMVAAAVSLLLVATVTLLINQYNTNMPSFSQELAEAERYYQEMVSIKLASVGGKLDTAPIIADFDEMDAAFDELKNDLKDDVDNQEVVEAMIANYRLKLKILEQIASELEEESYESEQTDL